MGYPAGYGLAVTCYIQMVVSCFLGQRILDRVILHFSHHDEFIILKRSVGSILIQICSIVTLFGMNGTERPDYECILQL